MLDLWRLARSRPGALALLVCFMPIASGAASNLWSAVAGDWRAGANTVALVNGAMSGVLSAAGCMVGGWLCDRLEHRTAYCLFGLGLAACALAMAEAPRDPAQFVVWTSVYSFVTGLGFAAYTVIVFDAIGQTAAATKFSLLASLANMPIQYLTLIDGAAHDRWGTNGLLVADGLAGIVGVSVFASVAAATRRRKPAGAASALA